MNAVTIYLLHDIVPVTQSLHSNFCSADKLSVATVIFPVPVVF